MLVFGLSSSPVLPRLRALLDYVRTTAAGDCYTRDPRLSHSADECRTVKRSGPGDGSLSRRATLRSHGSSLSPRVKKPLINHVRWVSHCRDLVQFPRRRLDDEFETDRRGHGDLCLDHLPALRDTVRLGCSPRLHARRQAGLRRSAPRARRAGLVRRPPRDHGGHRRFRHRTQQRLDFGANRGGHPLPCVSIPRAPTESGRRARERVR